MQNRVAASCFFALAVGLGASAPRLGLMPGGQPGPGLLPMTLAVVIAALAIALLFEPATVDPPSPVSQETGHDPESRSNVTKLVALTAGGLLAAPYIGLTVSIAWIAGAPLALIQRRPVWLAIVFGVTVGLAIRLVFGGLLGVFFPIGLLGV